jgi:hypothetical protein
MTCDRPPRRLFSITRRKIGAVSLAAMAIAGAVTSLSAASVSGSSAKPLSFHLVRGTNITACLPHASGHVTITPGSANDSMKVTVSGLPHAARFDLFVIQEPTTPFGISWYQTEIRTGSAGTGTATVRGVFNSKTFSVSPGGTSVFAPTHQYHLGLWFHSPRVPFNLGCEPGATAPIVTPFNGTHHAGVQVLNTSNFPVNAGPLSKLSR